MKKSLTTLLILSSVLLVGCSKSEETKSSSSTSGSSMTSSTSSKASTSSSSSSSVASSATSAVKTDAEIQQEVLNSVQGTWANAKGESFIISGDKFSFVSHPEITYDVTVDPKTRNVGLRTLGFGAIFAKAGTAFPDVNTSTNQWTDLTDQTRDRFLIGQNLLGSEETKELVFYKQ